MANQHSPNRERCHGVSCASVIQVTHESDVLRILYFAIYWPVMNRETSAMKTSKRNPIL